MTLKPALTENARTVGHISRAAQVRVDERVKEILAHAVRWPARVAKPNAPDERVPAGR